MAYTGSGLTISSRCLIAWSIRTQQTPRSGSSDAHSGEAPLCPRAPCIASAFRCTHARTCSSVAQAEEQCLIPLSACTARELEMRAEKKDAVSLRIEGTICVSKAAALPKVDTCTSLSTSARKGSRRSLQFTWALKGSFKRFKGFEGRLNSE